MTSPSGVRVNAVIVAAGQGRRMQHERPKPLLPLAGRPLLLHTIDRLVQVDAIRRLVLVVARASRADYATLLDATRPWATPLRVVEGGAQRQDSVRQGLAALDTACDIVVIHDAARPFVSVGAVEQSIRVAAESGSAVVATPARDTLKRAGSDATVSETLSRRDVWLAQTPQTFRVELIRDAHRQAHARGIQATDDASLVERLGHPVCIVAGDALNFKITTPDDLVLAEALLQAKRG